MSDGRRGRICPQHSTWPDVATATVPATVAPYCVADFRLAFPITTGSLRVVNLLDMFEIEVYDQPASPAIGRETTVRGLLVTNGSERLVIAHDITTAPLPRAAEGV